MGIIIFNGVSSMDLHTLVQHPPEYAFPEKDCEATHVPGRNGDIIVDTGSWKNVDRTYNLAIDARKISYTEVASKLVQWLHSSNGYARLEDSYEPDFYRMAIYKDQGTISNIYNKAGTIDVTFNCKPQRYFKSGEEPDTINHGMEYRNPTDFASRPKIIVHGSGSGNIYIGNYHAGVNSIIDGMTIDSEIQDVYYGTTNCNQNVSIDEFPKIVSGNNYISFSGGITSLEIIPRWWTL